MRRLISNWGRWAGGGASTRSVLWSEEFVPQRHIMDPGPPVPVMGGEASDTYRALLRIDADLAQVLIAHYTWRGGIFDKLDQLNEHRARRTQISTRTYYRRLAAAHVAFVEQYRALGIANRHVAESNSAAQGDAPAAVARRWKLVVTPKLGLLTPEEKAKRDHALKRG